MSLGVPMRDFFFMELVEVGNLNVDCDIPWAEQSPEREFSVDHACAFSLSALDGPSA